MGNPNSKIPNAKKDIQPDEGSLPSTPILTPKTKIIENDPRSPSANIARTPIHSIMDVNKPGTPIIGVLHSEDYENETVNIDPRSPAVEFTRTPIVVENKPIILRNKNLDNVRQQLIALTPMKSIDLNTSKGPKLISVTPITKKIEQNEKRKSYVGLLETDLDFIETDIDKVTKNNTLLSIEDSEEQVSEVTSTVEDENIQSESEEPKEKICKTDNIEDKQHDVTPENIEEPKKLTKEDIISPIKETLEKISQIDQEIKDVIACSHSPTLINLDEEADSKEFDKKVTNLIYEDQEVMNILPKSLKNKNENRTPLSERNVNHNNKKSTNKLKVHDRPLKKDLYAVSKIPVFKEKKGKSKIATQCENTPPRQKALDSKIKKSQWDADKTLII